MEYGVPIPKSSPPESLEDLRIISKTNFLSKIFKSFIVYWLLPYISPYLDTAQFGGFKDISTTHYLLKLLDFTHSVLDKQQPHAIVASLIDLSKAFNRVDHNILIADLHKMKCPVWILRIVMSYLSKRSLCVNYQGCSKQPILMPVGAPAGCYFEGLIFIIKFNGAMLRPSVPRHIKTKNKVENISHMKYFDDGTVAIAINLKENYNQINLIDKDL